jgi:hypothetical protein
LDEDEDEDDIDYDSHFVDSGQGGPQDPSPPLPLPLSYYAQYYTTQEARHIFLLRSADTLHFQPYTYYTAMALNLLMRMGWALVISPEQFYTQQHFLLILATVEIMRRILWAVIRVEWEYTKIKIKQKSFTGTGQLRKSIQAVDR